MEGNTLKTGGMEMSAREFQKGCCCRSQCGRDCYKSWWDRSQCVGGIAIRAGWIEVSVWEGLL